MRTRSFRARVLIALTFVYLIASQAFPGELPQCEMHVEYDDANGLLRAFYDTAEPGECYPEDEPLALWHPVWVQTDFQTTQMGMAVMDYPVGRRLERGWYMKPLLPPYGPTGTFEIQARSGWNNGRANVTVKIGRRGVTVQPPASR